MASRLVSGVWFEFIRFFGFFVCYRSAQVVLLSKLAPQQPQRDRLHKPAWKHPYRGIVCQGVSDVLPKEEVRRVKRTGEDRRA